MQQLLIFLGLFIEMTEGWTEAYPGCLYASYCYQEELFDAATYQVVVEGVKEWRSRLAGKIRDVMKKYPPKREVDAGSLADILITVVEGAMVVEKTLGEPHIVTRQVTHFRNYLELLFEQDQKLQ